MMMRRAGLFGGTRRALLSLRRLSTAAEATEDSIIRAPPSKEVKPIYMDSQATTPIDPRVLDHMMQYETFRFGNAHSRTHAYGWEAEEVVEWSREQVARLIGADAKEVVFTSGATESNNIAIKGVGRFYKKKKNHIITTAIEHRCVLDSCRALQQEGFEVTYLPVKSNGLVDVNKLKEHIRPETSLVSVMMANNEIGVVQPMKDIGQLCKDNKIFFHSDIAQAVGKLPIDVNELNIDLASISSHKIYGPKGVGALYVRRRPRVRVEPIFSGGGQERGIRSGTLPHQLIAGFGKAAEVAREEMPRDHKRISELASYLKNKIHDTVPEVVLNGDEEHRVPGNLNMSFAYVEGESLLMAVKDIAVSSGSACTSASLEPSYVLRALGVDDEMAHTSIRIGIGRFTTKQEVDYMADLFIKEVTRLREMSPLWEMVQEGIDLKTINWSQEH